MDRDSIFNNKIFLDRIFLDTNIRFDILSPTQKYCIVYDAVMASLGEQTKKTVVWNLDEKNCNFIYTENAEHMHFDLNLSTLGLLSGIKKTFGRAVFQSSDMELKSIIDFVSRQLERIPFTKKHAEALSGANIVGCGHYHLFVAKHLVRLSDNSWGFGRAQESAVYSKSRVYDTIRFLKDKSQDYVSSIIHESKRGNEIESQLCMLIMLYVVMDRYNIKTVQSIKSNEMYGFLVNQQ